MILLQYEMKIFADKSKAQTRKTMTVSVSNIRQELRKVFCRESFALLELEFHNSNQLCLVCRFSEETWKQDRNHIRNEVRASISNEYRMKSYTELADRIIAELMRYEREEFTYREITL